jgi:hypothetical protein
VAFCLLWSLTVWTAAHLARATRTWLTRPARAGRFVMLVLDPAVARSSVILDHVLRIGNFEDTLKSISTAAEP